MRAKALIHWQPSLCDSQVSDVSKEGFQISINSYWIVHIIPKLSRAKQQTTMHIPKLMYGSCIFAYKICIVIALLSKVLNGPIDSTDSLKLVRVLQGGR